jgi:excisionase family DNA binding protein
VIETTTATVEPLLLKPADAAKALAVCARHLRTLTARGEIPAVKTGRAVRYDPADLRAWIERKKTPLSICAPG